MLPIDGFLFVVDRLRTLLPEPGHADRELPAHERNMMHTGWLALSIVGGTVAFSVLGVVLVRRNMSLESLQRNHEVGGVFIGVLGGMYALLLGFIVVVVWQSFEDAKAGVAVEANEAGDLSRLAGGFRPELRPGLREPLVDYMRSVIRDEWPAMARREESPKTYEAIDRLWRTFLGVEPDGDREGTVYDQAISKLSDMSDSRRVRLHMADDRLPALIWVLLAGGGVTTLAFTYFFGVKSLVAQTIMTAMLAALIGFILLLILSLNRPFGGGVRVQSEELRKQLVTIEAQALANS